MTIESLFRIRERKSSVRIEVLGGLTTFATMAYIMVVNPAILSFAGIPVGPSTVATILVAVFGCLAMGLFANRPIAVAPYMGENAFIAFSMAAMAVTWEQRLGAVFVAGVVFALLTVTHLRQWLADSMSATMKHCMAIGIGIFLALIGLYETGIVASGAEGQNYRALLAPGSLDTLISPSVPMKIGNLYDGKVLLALFCFIVITWLMIRKVKGSILIGMAATAVLGLAFGHGKGVPAVAAVPFTGDYALTPIFAKLDIVGVLNLAFLPVLITLILMAFLDTTGTLMGLGASANMLDSHGRFPEIEKPMMVDAASCIVAPVLGTSTTGAFIESAAGIKEGAKTGLAAVTVAGLFALSLFFIPLLQPLQTFAFAYGPPLIVVGFLMVRSFKHVDFEDFTEYVPGFVTILMMVFTYNIANGMTAGLLLYPIMKTLDGRFKQVSAGAWALAVLSALYFLSGHVH